MISVLITGFEPFGGRDRNLSWEVAAGKFQESNGDCIRFTAVHEAGRYAHARYGCQKGKDIGRETIATDSH